MGTKEFGVEWLFNKDWAFGSKPSEHDQEQYAKALMICAAGDGTISRAERDWVKGYFAAFGCTDALFELLETYNGDEAIESVLTKSPAVAASSRALIHDAIRACSADEDLAADEMARIRKVNQLLGHDHELVDRWMDYYRDEDRLRRRRAEIIWTDPADKPY